MGWLMNYSLRVYTEKLCADKNNIWFAHSMLNVLFCVNTETKSVRQWAIPFRETYEVFYSDIICYEDKVYLIPGYANNLVIFDSYEETFEKIEMKYDHCYGRKWKYCGADIISNMLILIPRDDKLRLFDLAKMELKENKDIQEKIKAVANCGGYYFKKVKDGILIALSLYKTGLLFCNYISGKIEWKYDDIFSDKEYGADLTGNLLFFHNGINGEIRCLDIRTGDILNSNTTKHAIPAKISVIGNERVIVDYYQDIHYEVYDKNLNLLYVGETTNDRSEDYNGTYFSVFGEMSDGNIAQYNNCNNTLSVYSLVSEKTLLDINISIEERVRKQIAQYIVVNGLERERDSFPLDIFLGGIATG